MGQTWFEQWFNTTYYHILYSHRDEGEAQKFIKNLLDFLHLPPKSNVIDIGCGRGRHSKFLCEQGYEVTGIDIASSSIDYAKQFENDHLQFYCFDKRKVFKENSYDLALNLFTSFGFLKNRSELEVALNSMGKNLKNGGLIILDYMNAEKIKLQSFQSEEVVLNGIKFTSGKKIQGHRIIKEIEVKDGDTTKNYTEEVHLITLSEFRELFEFASLKILHTFGDYQLNDYDPVTSDRLILIAEKL